MGGYIDMHCDTLMHAFFENKDDIYQMPERMFDFHRFQQSKGLLQFLAVFFLPKNASLDKENNIPEDMDYFNQLYKIYDKTVKKYSDEIGKVRNFKEYQNNRNSRMMGALLTMEDGRALDNNLENLNYFYHHDVRLISLTWNYENCIGFPNSSDIGVMQMGLKEFGKEVVESMNQMGIIVDVSHLSDGGFQDVVKISKKPFVASHSNCRQLCPHPRNMSDEMIRILGETGGVMGMNFAPDFLDNNSKNAKSTVALLVKHMKHAITIGGIECVSIGTDFDGIKGDLEISSPDKMYLLWDEMKKEGLSEQEIDKVMYKNIERVLKEIL